MNNNNINTFSNYNEIKQINDIAELLNLKLKSFDLKKLLKKIKMLLKYLII